MKPYKILIAGAGGIGQAVGLILQATDYLPCELFIADRYLSAAQSAESYIKEGCTDAIVTGVVMPENGTTEAFASILAQVDLIMDCLPGSQAPRLAKFARDYNCHYINLTEYVAETEEVVAIADGAETGFALQTGLAPGYINVLGHHLYKTFCAIHEVDTIDTLEMKVGALSKHARSPYFYAYTWSPIGVATEYVKDSLVVQDYVTSKIPSLSQTETLLIDGIEYEDDFTSGGAADLPSALQGKVKNLSYKTIRYPGHFNWARQIISGTPDSLDKVDYLHNTMMDNIPSVEDDIVIVFASAKGKDSQGRLRAVEKSLKIYPTTVGTKTLRAIQTTTAVPMCECARLLLQGGMKGPIYQSQLDTDSFLNGPFVKSIYGPIL